MIFYEIDFQLLLNFQYEAIRIESFSQKEISYIFIIKESLVYKRSKKLEL